MVTRQAADAQATEPLESIGRVLRVLSTTRYDLSALLEEIAARAVELCGADKGFIYLKEADEFRCVATSGGSPEHWRYERDHPTPIGRETLVGRVALDNGAVHIRDVLEDSEYQWPEGQRLGGYRTMLGVPIRLEEDLIGVIGLARDRVAPFEPDQIALVSLFGDQAGLAVNLAGLYRETREALDRESAVSGVLQVISRSAFDLQRVLDIVVENAVKLSGADQGDLVALDGSAFRDLAHSGPVPPGYWELIRTFEYGPERGSVTGRVLLERRPVQIPDVEADPEYRLKELQQLAGFRTILGVPLLREGEPIGSLNVWRREMKPFSDREISLVSTFADQAALAMENVRLFETVERQRRELAGFAPHVAALLESAEGEQLLAGHRREITALFCDLRGFTSFAEMAEPEEVLGVLREYQAAVGTIAIAHGGTVEHFAGDGLMIFFNDPTPVPDHQQVAMRSALAIRSRFDELAVGWRKRGYDLGLGIGAAVGYATLGRIGFEGRYDYGGVGNVVILASRLSTAAGAGEILISQRTYAAVEDQLKAEPVDELQLKGFSHPVTAYRLLG